MLRRRITSGIFTTLLLCISLLVAWTPSYGQLSEIEFIDFDMSDTVAIGGTLTITGILKNNGTIPIPGELALRMATGTLDSPPAPYSNHYYENNFNNSIIYPGELQSFVRLIEVTEEWFDIASGNLQQNKNTAMMKSAAARGKVVAVIWPRGGGAQLQNKENSPQFKSAFDNLDMYMDSIVVLQPDELLVQESYDSNPGILTGIEFKSTPLEYAMPDDIVGFRHDGANWIQVPIQVDEMKWVDPYLLYSGFPSGVNTDSLLIKVYADTETHAGADDTPAFDDNDELVFMLKDAGDFVDLDSITLPIGIIPSTGVEISIQNSVTQKDSYVYLFKQDGSLLQDADTSYVSYDFSLLLGNYLLSYNTNYNNPENTNVVGENYTLHFSDTWVTEDIHMIDGQSSGIDILDAYDTFLGTLPFFNFDISNRCFIANKAGPIRGIRSYMRGELLNPVDIQKTHFFYAKRHDVFTNLLSEYSSSLFDFLDINVTHEEMNYQNNIDLTPLIIDNADDSLCLALYSDIPLKWELIEGTQGSMGVVHEVLIDGIPNNDGLLNGYWSDGDVNSYIAVNGKDGADGADGDGGNGALIATNGIGMWMDMDSINTNQQSDIEYRRYTYFDEPDMPVGAVTAHSASIRQQPLLDVSDNVRHYDIQISAYLEGPFEDNRIEMNNSLNIVHKLLPGQTLPNDSISSSILITPYNTAPWNYVGTEPNTFPTKPYSSNIVDWVLVSFRTGLTPASEVARTLGLITQDGTIEFLSNSILTKEDGANFYIVVEHRNHIGIMSPTPVKVVDYKLKYDFRIQNSFTNNGVRYGQKQVSPGIWAMYAGEGLQNASGYDINGQDKTEWSLKNGTFSTYSFTDFNMDGSIDGKDKAIWSKNNGISGALIR